MNLLGKRTNRLFIGIFLMSCFTSIAQSQTDITLRDTLMSDIISKVQSYAFQVKRDSVMMRRSVDITPIAAALPSIESRLSSFRTRLEKSGRQMNLMGLNTTLIFMKESVAQLSGYESQLKDYYDQLSQNRENLIKIIKDPSLNIATPDSSLSQEIKDLKLRAFKLDTLQTNNLAKITIVRNRVSLALLNADDIISNLNFFIVNTEQNMWKSDESPLFKARPSEYDQSLFSLVNSAIGRAAMVVRYYLKTGWDAISIALFIFILIISWLWLNMYRIKKLSDRDEILKEAFFLLPDRIIIGSIMVFFTYLPFLLGNPPPAFLHACALLRTAILCFLLYPYFTKQYKVLWIIFCVLWLFFLTDDLFPDSAFAERWILFIAGFVFAALCIQIIRSHKSGFIRISQSRLTKPLVIFCLAQIVLALISNLTGRVTLTKILSVSAVQCLMLGITLKVLIKMILESVYLQSEAYKESRFAEYINYQALEDKYKKILIAIACLVWFIGLTRSWDIYNFVVVMVTVFFEKNRTLGGHTFNFGSIAVFVGIIWISIIISDIIKFFFGRETGTPAKRNNLASMMLLVRLAIWALGFIIAVTAAGIPMSKITIMLGALSVGIGFGLQNIANNLVSGIILAFERPIQVGDQIEIDGKSGKVKEIGVRSSKLSTGDGADLIIPNGDLLSRQLTNWTMQNLHKSISFVIGIEYSADIMIVRKIILDTLEKNDKILKTPSPSIVIDAFADTALNIKVSAWIPDLSNAGSTRSRIMFEVYNALSTAGIKHPYPHTTMVMRGDGKAGDFTN
jgi:small-conductance mechanosensitive channel